LSFENLLNTAEAAEQLRVKKQTLENWRLRGEGPAFIKVGRRVFYRLSALDAWLTGRIRTSTSEEAA
jgi:excisionase family DNA binding protein